MTADGIGLSGERYGVPGFAVFIGLIAGLLTFPIPGAVAQGAADRFAAIHEQSLGWNNRPATDATPIAFSIDEVHYSVPRNYLVWMDHWGGGPQTLVRFKAALPGFEPFTEKTRACMTAAPANRPAGCVPLEFFIRRGRSDPTDDERFSNARRLFHSQNPLPGPFGFELYETGPPEARVNTYRKVTGEHMLMIQCILPPSGGQDTSMSGSPGLFRSRGEGRDQ